MTGETVCYGRNVWMFGKLLRTRGRDLMVCTDEVHAMLVGTGLLSGITCFLAGSSPYCL